MEIVHERVARLEGRVEEHRDVLNDIRTNMDLRFDAVDRRFEAVDRRFEAVDRRFEVVDRRFDGIDRRLDRMDDKMTRLFLWQVGIHVTTLTAAVAAILGAVLTR